MLIADLLLSEGWEIVPGKRQGDFTIARKQ
jgi:hypothetical protein